MKKIAKLKLSQLNKDSIEKRRMSHLIGGTLCYYGDVNQQANEAEGKCSCWCTDYDYYDTNEGLSALAGIYKYW